MLRNMNPLAIIYLSLGITVGTVCHGGEKTEKTETPVLPGWKLAWADEFNTDGLPDSKKWGYEEGFTRNEELQYYMKARKENSRIENGTLIIEGRKKKPIPNPRVGKGYADWQKNRKVITYTAASLITRDTYNFTYGRVEVRAKMPKGKGAWPAIWMMGATQGKVSWPECGEIDVMEWLGRQPDIVHGTVHWADPKSKKARNHTSNGGKIKVEKPPYDFHVYAIEWDKDKIDFFFDGKKYHTFELDKAGKGKDNAFRKPMYLLINLALGGSWGKELDDKALPMKYVIDYARIYQRP